MNAEGQIVGTVSVSDLRRVMPGADLSKNVLAFLAEKNARGAGAPGMFFFRGGDGFVEVFSVLFSGPSPREYSVLEICRGISVPLGGHSSSKFGIRGLFSYFTCNNR